MRSRTYAISFRGREVKSEGHNLLTDEEFETFLSSAREELRNKQDLLVEQYGFGTRNRWWFDQTTEKLQLFDEADNLVIEADVMEIGSYLPVSACRRLTLRRGN